MREPGRCDSAGGGQHAGANGVLPPDQRIGHVVAGAAVLGLQHLRCARQADQIRRGRPLRLCRLLQCLPRCAHFCTLFCAFLHFFTLLPGSGWVFTFVHGRSVFGASCEGKRLKIRQCLQTEQSVKVVACRHQGLIERHLSGSCKEVLLKSVGGALAAPDCVVVCTN